LGQDPQHSMPSSIRMSATEYESGMNICFFSPIHH
jgi:hypothetical protein